MVVAAIHVDASADAQQVFLRGREIVGGPFRAAIDHLLDDFFPLGAGAAGRENAVRVMAVAAHAPERRRRRIVLILRLGANRREQCGHSNDDEVTGSSESFGGYFRRASET